MTNNTVDPNARVCIKCMVSMRLGSVKEMVENPMLEELEVGQEIFAGDKVRDVILLGALVKYAGKHGKKITILPSQLAYPDGEVPEDEKLVFDPII